MGKNLDKAMKISAKLTLIAEQRIRKELDALAKSGLISRKEGRQLLKAAIKEARKERERVRKFIIAEMKRELKKAKPIIKKTLKKKQKQFMQYRKKRKR